MTILEPNSAWLPLRLTYPKYARSWLLLPSMHKGLEVPFDFVLEVR